ncbi:hypothetical protein HUJ04_002219 [Dendroctonus ponderosae]|nr:hypothetical protein HUJ04_002219 [Dendroctonus ponderosae]KAH1009929.1 hypothetical protein HUJ04_002219 [Dendroctonus ponderosae]
MAPNFQGLQTNAGRKRAHPFVRLFVQILCRNTENQTRRRPLRRALCAEQVREKPLSLPCFSAKLSDGQSEKVVQIIRIASVFRLTPTCNCFRPHWQFTAARLLFTGGVFQVWKIEPAAAGAADSGMSSPSARNRERILEAIDQLRKRKARPDVARICSYLFRRFHVNSVEAKADLEWCVANSIVLKVEYKGNISYRNAAKKWAQMRHREAQGHSATPNSLSKLAISRNFMELLTNVFGELVVEEPDYLEIGVPPKEIIENILTKDSVRYTRNYIAILLIKETERGNLIKLANGHFLLGPCADDRRQEWMTRETEQKLLPATCRDGQTVSSKRSYNDHSSAVQIQADAENSRQAIVKPKKRMIAKVQAAAQRQESLERQARMYAIEDKHCEGRADSIRSGGRRKKARKVFDPSDTHVPKKRGRPAGSLNKNTIEKQHVFKVRDEDSRPNSRSSTSSNHGGVCSVSHYGCLNGDDMMLKLCPDNTWQCPHCKICVECFETSNAGNLIVCSVCADGYHPSCHPSIITEKIKNGSRWICSNCQMTDDIKLNDIHTNIGETVRHNISVNNDGGKEALQFHSNSEQSTPYDSPAGSPPILSPIGKISSDPDREGNSDSNSGKEESEHEDPTIDPSIPDATHWTPDEVYQYFAQFFPEEAKVFKEQEIDGRSLLLLKRMDVLTSLNLKLGPALKIYRHVTMLQVRRDDRSLYWL